MAIQWFPGHMNKARKEVKETLPLIDIVIEVLDARLPYSSENPMIGALGEGKTRLKLLTKSDLADPDKTALWLDYFKREKAIDALALTTEHPEQIRRLTGHIRRLLPDREGSHKTINVMIMGIPNVGKSTLINTLAGRNIAKTGNEPAVTKGQQKIKLEQGILLFDTPGMLWPKVENPNSAYRLATTGAIKDTAISHLDVAYFAADFMLRDYPQRLRERYGLDALPEPGTASAEIELLELIGARRGCLSGGGRVDLERVATLFLNELRNGSLGPITLEVPSMIEPEEREVERLKAEKAARDEERKARRKQKK